MDELDPRWEWVSVPTLDDLSPSYVRGRCKHLELKPVTDVTGERVATLCRTCDVTWDLDGQPLGPHVRL
jgi:hypothetical protein